MLGLDTAIKSKILMLGLDTAVKSKTGEVASAVGALAGPSCVNNPPAKSLTVFHSVYTPPKSSLPKICQVATGNTISV